jgi:DNA-binding transcriptional LysR family regulator
MFRSAVEDQLRAGEIDLGIVTGDGDELWHKDELIVVASPKVDPKSVGFVTFPEGSATRALMRKHFGDIDVVMELSGIAAVKSNVRAGVGIALLSRSAVEADLKSGKLVRVRWPKTPIRRGLFLIHSGLGRLAPAATTIREMLLEDAPRRTKR